MEGVKNSRIAKSDAGLVTRNGRGFVRYRYCLPSWAERGPNASKQKGHQHLDPLPWEDAFANFSKSSLNGSGHAEYELDESSSSVSNHVETLEDASVEVDEQIASLQRSLRRIKSIRRKIWSKRFCALARSCRFCLAENPRRYSLDGLFAQC